MDKQVVAFCFLCPESDQRIDAMVHKGMPLDKNYFGEIHSNPF